MKINTENLSKAKDASFFLVQDLMEFHARSIESQDVFAEIWAKEMLAKARELAGSIDYAVTLNK